MNIKLLVVSVLVALFLSVGAAYAVVVSQNSATHVPGSSVNYGPAERPSP